MAPSHQQASACDHETYKLIELVGVSDVGIDDPIKNALSRAGQTLKGLDRLQVTETRGVLNDGQVTF